MIKIKRTSCPEVLRASPKKGDLYNKREVVKALWRMQQRKCCYCEREIPEKGHAKSVEHFRPKSVYKGKRNDWQNLLLACAQCNGKKSNKFPTTLTNNEDEPKVLYLKKGAKVSAVLIDPSGRGVDPEEHITFIVDDRRVEEYGLPVERNESKKGRATIDIVGLDGSFYVRKRRTWHRSLKRLYLNLLEAKDQDNKVEIEICCQTFRLYMSANKEFAAYAREFARHIRLDRNFTIEIPVGNEV
jgi:uncharacterized protein (TIGR02646 family)